MNFLSLASLVWTVITSSSILNAQSSPSGIIVITSPDEGSSIESGANSIVEWSLVPSASEPEYNVTLSCPDFDNVTTTTMYTIILFPIQSDYYGSCQFSVQSENYYTPDPLNVIVTQQISLLTPVSGETYPLSSPTINVQYVTAGNTTISGATLAANFSCESGTSSLDTFDVNPTSVNIPYTYPADSYGNCSLTAFSASESYLIAPNDPVYFFLKYNASFSDPPTELYILQDFNITIGTNPVTSGSAVSETITLGIFCNGNVLVPVQTFDPIVTNEQQTLTLDSAVQAGQCVLMPTIPSNVFTTDFYQNVTVSPVPIYFDESTVTEYLQPGNFSILVDSLIPNATGSFNITLNCTALLEPIGLPYTLGTIYDDAIPAEAYGNCTLNVTDLAFTLIPGPLMVAIQYVLGFDGVPSTVYINQPFNLTVNSTGTPPPLLTTQVQLICGGTVITDVWTDEIPLNQQVQLTVPPSVSPNSNCVLETVSSPNFVQAIFSPLSVQNVTLQIDLPDGSYYINGAPILINVTAVDFPDLRQDLNVSFVCGTEIDEVIPVVTGVQSSYTPVDAYGQCTFSIPTPPAGFSPPTPVDVTINWQLSIVSEPEIYVGIPFDIEVDPLVPSGLATNTTVKLCCDSSRVDFWDNVPFGQVVQLTTASNLSNYTDCYFRTASSNQYIIDASSSNLDVEKLTLNFDLPTDGETVVIPNNITVLVSTVPVTTPLPLLNITAQITCPNGLIDTGDSLQTNSLTSIIYDDSLYGACDITLINYPEFLNPPSVRNFSIKFGLEFVDPPTILRAGESFNVFIQTSYPPPAILGTTTLALICDSVLIQSWSLVNLDIQNTLQLSPSTSQFLNNCALSTPADDEYFITAFTPVVIEPITSPTGGKLYPITPEELAEFVSLLPTAPGIPLIPLTSNFEDL